MPYTTKAKIITSRELSKLRYPLSESWTKAIGLLKGKSIDPLHYQREVRKAWGRRVKRQIKLARGHGR